MAASSSRGATLSELKEEAELKKAIIAEAAARLHEEKSALEELVGRIKTLEIAARQDAIMLPSDEEVSKLVAGLKAKTTGKCYKKVTDVYRRLVEEGLIPNARDDDSGHQAGDWEIERTECSYSFIITCRAFLETKTGSLSEADEEGLQSHQIPGPWMA